MLYGNISKKTYDLPCRRKALCYLTRVDNTVHPSYSTFPPHAVRCHHYCYLYGGNLFDLHRMICRITINAYHTVLIVNSKPYFIRSTFVPHDKRCRCTTAYDPVMLLLQCFLCSFVLTLFQLQIIPI